MVCRHTSQKFINELFAQGNILHSSFRKCPIQPLVRCTVANSSTYFSRNNLSKPFTSGSVDTQLPLATHASNLVVCKTLHYP